MTVVVANLDLMPGMTRRARRFPALRAILGGRAVCWCGGYFGTHDATILHGDGQVDDTEAMQRLVARADLALEAGVYPVSETIHLSHGLRGAPEGPRSTLRWSGPPSATMLRVE